jgi:D-mannonate dehydratase
VRFVIGSLREASGVKLALHPDDPPVLKEFKAMNFDGVLIDGHVPKVVKDSTWGHRSRAYATGYIKGLIRAVDALS